MGNFTVYVHTNQINGKKYVGITSQEPHSRWLNGNGYKTQVLFYRAIKKYGWDNFDHDILYTGLNCLAAQVKEIELIQNYQSNNKEYGYNCTIGGEGTLGYRHNKQTRGKIKQNNAKHWKDKNRSQETKDKISKANSGRKLSTSTKAQMSKTRTGKKLTDDWSRHISEGKKGKRKGAENPKSKKVKCLETGEVFESAGLCAEHFNLNYKTVCEGIRRNLRTAGKYHFVHLREDNK